MGPINEEVIDYLQLEGAANTIRLEQDGLSLLSVTGLGIASFWRDPSATLDYQTEGVGTSLIFDASATPQLGEINDYGGTKITPWATVNGQDFGTPVASGVIAELRPVTDGTNFGGYNAHITNNRSLTNWIIPNSLKMGDVTINMNGHELRTASGGLLTYTGNPVFQNATLSAGTNRMFYAHIYSNSLTLIGTSRFFSNTDNGSAPLVKTGPGSLVFDSSATHTPTAIYIHQGTVDLRQGSINTGHIYIGDGAGRDMLILPRNRTDPLLNKPNITLRGTPYGLDPSNVYGGEESDQAILRFGGNTKQRISTLTIVDRGTIDFAGGAVGLANILWVDWFNFSSTDARLFIRNWYQNEDYLLVRKIYFNQNDGHLNRIIFDGYQEFPVLAINYDSDYYQITPFFAPEPATYGAIVGAVGLGLWAWRKSREKRRRAPK